MSFKEKFSKENLMKNKFIPIGFLVVIVIALVVVFSNNTAAPGSDPNATPDDLLPLPTANEQDDMTQDRWEELLKAFEDAVPYTADPNATPILVPTPNLGTKAPNSTPVYQKPPDLPYSLDPLENTPDPRNGLTFPYPILETDLTVLRLDAYTGPYVESGENEQVEDCVAILLKNDSNQTVEYVELHFEVNGKDEAVFKALTIPPGACVFVLEAGKLKHSSEDVYMFKSKMVSMEDGAASLHEDQIKISGGSRSLMIVNQTDKAFSRVKLYYKNIYVKDVYFGGITYTRTFNDVQPNVQYTLDAPNFIPGVCKMMRVEIIE